MVGGAGVLVHATLAGGPMPNAAGPKHGAVLPAAAPRPRGWCCGDCGCAAERGERGEAPKGRPAGNTAGAGVEAAEVAKPCWTGGKAGSVWVEPLAPPPHAEEE